MDDSLLIPLLVFIAMAMVVYVGFVLLKPKTDKQLRNRLNGKHKTDEINGTKPKGVTNVLSKVGQVAAAPFMPKTREAQGDLRKRLGYAGIYSVSAIKLVTGAKVIFLALGLVGGYLVSTFISAFMLKMAILSTGGLIGYLGPMFWMKWAIKNNRKQLAYGLADALDLMVVCVEAGLTVDSAMLRVGQEMSIAHPAICRELGICHMESRVGLSRVESLSNLGTRTGSEPLRSLASMLIQADRFGTSIASALRVHADTLRNNRHFAAEELAAKASVKMSFPLVLFIFPATFIVLAGPTVIGLINSPLFN